MVSIRMIKICDASICKPLELIFKTCLENGKFPTEQKKANAVSAHKKGDEQNFKNCHPISFISVAGKIFERILYNNMYEIFTENNLISLNKSDFKPGDHVLTNVYPSLMKFTNLLTFEVYFRDFKSI